MVMIIDDNWQMNGNYVYIDNFNIVCVYIYNTLRINESCGMVSIHIMDCHTTINIMSYNESSWIT